MAIEARSSSKTARRGGAMPLPLLDDSALEGAAYQILSAPQFAHIPKAIISSFMGQLRDIARELPLGASANIATHPQFQDLVTKSVQVFERDPAVLRAHLQLLQKTANIHSADGAVYAKAMASLQGLNAGDGGMTGGGSRERNSRDYGMMAANDGSIKDASGRVIFSSGELNAMGMSGHTAQTLMAMGFTSKADILKITSDTKRLGLKVENAAIDLGELRKAEGKRTDAHVTQLESYKNELTRIETQRKEAEKTGNQQKLAEAERQRVELEKRIDEYKKKEVKAEQGKKKFEQIREKVRENVGQDKATNKLSAEQLNEINKKDVKNVAQQGNEQMRRVEARISQVSSGETITTLPAQGPTASAQVKAKEISAASDDFAIPGQAVPVAKQQAKVEEKTAPKVAPQKSAPAPT